MRLDSALAILLAVTAPAFADDDAPASDAAPPPEPAPPPAPAAGTLRGRVVDKATGLGLPAATIQLTDASGARSVATEIDGTFELALPPGTYTIVFATPEYIDQARTITVAEAGAVEVEVALELVPARAREETIEIFDTIDTHKASAVLAERRAAATVSDAISAEQIQRSPDSNASDAAKRMVAATIEDNRYVVIRGLGGRYSLTLLNGIPLPSPDPDVPAAPLDLFPAAMLTNLTVHKTAAPDLPASFAGGALSIETRSYPTKFAFKARVAMSGDSQSSFHALNGYRGGSFDVLGYDDGTRALPSSISDDKLAIDPAQAAAFHDIWNIHRGSVGPNLGLGATLGDTFRVGDQRIGYYANASYGHGYTNRLSHIARVGEPDGKGGYLPSVLQLDDREGAEHASVGAVLATGWKPAPHHSIDAFALYTHTADISASQVTGIDNSTAIVDRTRLRMLQRELAFGELYGEHRLGDSHATLTWNGNLARVAQHEPDTRDLLRAQTPDGRFAIDHSSGSAERLFAELADTSGGGAADVMVPFAKIRLKAGTSVARSSRTYQARRFHFDVSGDSIYLDPEDALVGSNMSMLELTLPTDGYVAKRTTLAGYAMADANATDKLRLVGGARIEASTLDVGLDSKIDLGVPPGMHTTHDTRDVLPSLDVVYAVTPAMNVRAAYGMTVARPNFREIAPALYYDYVRRRAIGGNPDLLETKIHNADVRWEMFLGDNEVIAASAFAKHFVSPIERTVEDAGDGQNVGFANASGANSYGVELEARLSLARVHAALAPVSLGANLALIGSRIDLMGAARPLQGQSPYVANVDLGYDAAAWGAKVDVLYNAFGRRIEEVGSGGAGNVYEQPFHRVDLVVSKQLPRNMKLKLAGSNLLGQRVVQTQNGVEVFAYRPGVAVLGSVEIGVE